MSWRSPSQTRAQIDARPKLSAFIGSIAVGHREDGGVALVATDDSRFVNVTLTRSETATLAAHLFAAAFETELVDDSRLQAAYNALCHVADAVPA